MSTQGSEYESRPESGWTPREPILHIQYPFNVRQIHSLSRSKFFVHFFFLLIFYVQMFLEKKIVSKKNRAKPPVLGEEGWQSEH